MPNSIQQQNNISYGAFKDIISEQSKNKLPKNLQPNAKERVQNATEDAKEAMNDSAGMQMMAGMLDGMDMQSPKTWGVIGGFWVAFAALNDLLNLNLHNDWNKTIFGKFGQAGDRIQTAFMNHRASNALNPLKKITGFIKDKLPFLTTPLNPENSMARAQAGGIFLQVSSGMNSVLGKYMKSTPDGFKHLFTNAQSQEQAMEWLEQISRDPKLHADKLDDLITNLTKNKDIVGNKVKVALNKYISVGQKYLKNPQNKTWLGKKLATMPTSVMEFATNGTAAGKLFIGIQALVFAQAAFKAAKAPKGEKKATFMENVMGDFVYAAAAPLMLMPANTIGGLKYVGMGAKGAAGRQAAVKNYREVLHSLNTLIKEGRLEGDALIKNHVIEKASDIVIGLDGKVQGLDVIVQKGKKVLKDLLYKDAKGYQKPIKKIGEFFSMGLESVKGSSLLKGKAGAVLRLVIAMFLVAPLISKITRKVSHKLFGKPTSAIKEEEEALAKKAEKKAQKAQKKANREAVKNINPEELKARLEAHPEITSAVQNDPEMMAEIQKNPMLIIQMLDEADKKGSQTTNQMPQNNNANLSPAMQKILNGSNPRVNQAVPVNMSTNVYQPAIQTPLPDNSQAIAGNNKTKVNNEPKRTYIPSSAPVTKSALDQAHDLKMHNVLEQADEIEKFINENIGI